MKLNRTVAVTAVVATLAGAATLGAGVVSAHPGAGDGLVERIATRFNLNQDEVQHVVDEVRSEYRAEHRTRFEEQFDEAVEAGTLTAEQKELIEGKMTQMKEKHEELKDWADEHDIPLGKIMRFGHGGPGKHFSHH